MEAAAAESALPAALRLSPSVVEHPLTGQLGWVRGGISIPSLATGCSRARPCSLLSGGGSASSGGQRLCGRRCRRRQMRRRRTRPLCCAEETAWETLPLGQQMKDVYLGGGEQKHWF